MSMFPLCFDVEAACAHKQPGNMQNAGQKKERKEGVLRN